MGARHLTAGFAASRAGGRGIPATSGASTASAAAAFVRQPGLPAEELAGDERQPPSLAEWLGWALLASLLLATLIGCLAFNRSGRPSLIGDEATYAMQAASLAWDFDLAYSRRDYDRFVAHWGGPPDGVILQSRDGGAHITYGKPFLYALITAPFVRISPLRGALLANVLMLGAAAVLAARTLRLRAGPLAPLAVTVLLFGSVAFAYVFWVHADVMLLAATAAGFAVVYGADRSRLAKGTAASQLYTHEVARPGWRWARRWMLAGLLLAIPGAYRPFYLLLLLPAAAAVPAGRRRQGLGALAAGALALLAVTALVQYAAGGGWSGYTGQRLGFYQRTGYPAVDFPVSQWDQKLREWGNTSWIQEGAFDPSSSPRLWAWNSLYFLAGQNVGVLPYFLPLLLCALAFRGDRGRWLIPLAVGVAAGCFLLVRPFNFYGGGGAIANRYFLPLYAALWFMAARRLRAAEVLLAAALAGPFLWPLWHHPAAFPIGDDGRYRHVSEAARRLLPYETTQSHIPGGQDTNEHGIWVKLLSRDVWKAAPDQGLRMQANGEAELLVGSPTPLPFLAVELDRRAPARLELRGVALRPSVLRPNGWEVFELPLRQPRAVHPMWWTHDDVYLYQVAFRLPGGGSLPVGLELRRGEDPDKFDLGIDAGAIGGDPSP